MGLAGAAEMACASGSDGRTDGADNAPNRRGKNGVTGRAVRESV